MLYEDDSYLEQLASEIGDFAEDSGRGASQKRLSRTHTLVCMGAHTKQVLMSKESQGGQKVTNTSDS